MKKSTRTFLLLVISLLGWSAPSLAQDNNMLAKIAYETAEEALAAGKVTESFRELNKVDSLLKKITPKSMYLRVQLFHLATQQDPGNAENAIKICNEYLGLAKSFTLPEDKVMEVTKLRIRLEKQKAEWDHQNNEEERAVARVKSVLDSIYSLCHYKVGMSGEEVLKANPEFAKQMKTKTEGYETWHTHYNGTIGYTGPTAVSVQKGGKVSLYTYRYKTVDSKDEFDMAYEFANKWKPLLESVFPQEAFVSSSHDNVKINMLLGQVYHYITFELGEFKKAKTMDVSIGSQLVE
ncbi:MAG TPA: hypothetical protein VGE66_13065 [Chitinophagaceae bacterium]